MTDPIRFQSAAAAGRLAPCAVLAVLLAAAPVQAQSARGASDPGRAGDCAQATEQPQLINERAVARRVSHAYPGQLLDFGVHGRALLELTVGPTGRVERVGRVEATHASFGLAARGFARAMRFAPAKAGGVPVRCRVVVPVDFAIADG